MKILFVIKANTDYAGSYSKCSGGLLNSAKFVSDMFMDYNEFGRSWIESRVVEVQDNNDIDRVVSEFSKEKEGQVNYVVIEALWVVPEKFDILQKLYPNIKWIIRLHSHIPFLANEGIAMDWLQRYDLYENVFIGVNYYPAKESLEKILGKKVLYLPNYYPISEPEQKVFHDESLLEIGCFGAIRPMKNQLIQAIAAIRFAEELNKDLFFHINIARVEQKGEEVLKNIRALFNGSRATLVEHPWLNHSDFVKLVKSMDLGMQVSLSETYNIVAADFVNQEVPIVTSSEIEFINHYSHCSTKDINSIIKALKFAYDYPKLNAWRNKQMLRSNSEKARKEWLKLK